MRRWEQGSRQPDGPTRACIRAIERAPKAMQKASHAVCQATGTNYRMVIIKLGIEAPCPQRHSTIRFSSVFAVRQAKSIAAALNA
jgi:hypothetical protein